MKTVILCGGKGMRMGLEQLPKPLFEIGGRPILWHIIKHYESFGIRDFVLLLGYKKEKIIDYFKDYKISKIEFIDSGANTNTGGRIKKAKRCISEDIFFATYGDGLSDVNLNKLFCFHKKHKRIVTITSIRPNSPFGIMGIDSHTNLVTHFEEKPILDHWVNGGFFVFNRKIFDYIREADILETDTFSRLLKKKQLSAYKHNGFWECMDTYKDAIKLNQLWDSGNAPWAAWHKKKDSSND
ncbi:MAG: sugar phosphate nucleotidyltransferase [Candidatus Omnitrophica bacterium]|nr:sugar phosphate nucleotidyltransferase [Candidatus Omnitrophota bacterium]